MGEKGWFNERTKHSLAAKGVETKAKGKLKQEVWSKSEIDEKNVGFVDGQTKNILPNIKKVTKTKEDNDVVYLIENKDGSEIEFHKDNRMLFPNGMVIELSKASAKRLEKKLEDI